MGIALTYFVLYPPPRPGSPWPLARVIRPSAPDSSDPAIDFAEALAHGKANALARAWLASNGDSPDVVEAMGVSSWEIDASFEQHPIASFHGSEFDVWWTRSSVSPSRLAIAPALDEAEFWRRIADENSARELGELRRPAERIRVRLLTEADARLVDHPHVLAEDLDWVSEARFGDPDPFRGLAAELAGVLAMHPIVTEEEIDAAKAELIEDAIRQTDLHTGAFLCCDLARFDSDAAIEWIEALAEAIRVDDREHERVPAALASVLFALRGLPACEALIESWQGADGPAAQVLAELGKWGSGA